MAGYCVLADVVREMGRYGPNLTAVSVPSNADATALIDQIAAEIDGVLAARGYQVPVAVPPNPAEITAWISGFLKRLNAIGTAGVVLQGMFPHATGPASSNLGESKTSEYRSLLGKMMTDAALYPDSLIHLSTNQGSGPRSLWTDGNVDSESVEVDDDEFDPIFTRTVPW